MQDNVQGRCPVFPASFFQRLKKTGGSFNGSGILAGTHSSVIFAG